MTPDQIIATGIAVFIGGVGLSILALALIPVIDAIRTHRKDEAIRAAETAAYLRGWTEAGQEPLNIDWEGTE